MSSKMPISFKARIYLGYLILIGLLTIIAAVTLYEFREITAKVDLVDSQALPQALLSQKIAFNVVQVQQFLTDVSATHDPAGYQDAEDAAQAFSEAIYKFRQLSPDDKQTLSQLDHLNHQFKQYYAEGKRMAKTYTTQGIEAGNQIMASFDQTAESLSQLVQQTEDEHVTRVSLLTQSIDKQSHFASWITIIVFIVSLCVAIIISMLITNKLQSQLGIDPFFVQGIAKELSKGNLQRDIRVDKDDTSSLIYAIKIMQGNLKHIITTITTTAAHVSQAADQLSDICQVITVSAESQNQYALTTAAAMEEMTASINEITQNSSNAASQADQAGEAADEGFTIVHDAAEEMEEIANVVAESSQIIGKLSDSSQHISEVVEVINQIATQTNLLALNAAIEAARAGEQGRGFAVVADEVRGLAERTSNSTQEVAGIIEEIQGNSDNAVVSMKKGHDNVNEGVTKAKRAGESMSLIKNGTTMVRDSINNISVAMDEQNTVVKGVAQDVGKISELVNENNLSINKLNATILELKEMAASLNGAISVFKV
ncbi:MAG: methyl-accepting chemotaxis protein [Methylococcaceae bacterium]|nr:methyl-accepting chemotaxis protein [Methylococcaceae bacterium]